jgi:hypothetical protein
MDGTERDGDGPRLDAARQQLRLSLSGTWMLYFGVGGNATVAQVTQWLRGGAPIPSLDHDYLAQALNDVFLEGGQDHPLPYRRLPR